jgi:hypothetical protein
MQPLPPYYLPRPALDLSAEQVAAFERLYAGAVAPGGGGEIAYSLAAPRWQFLCWLTDTQDVLLHGSGNPAIAEFEPRQSNDTEQFGNRKAVYAASDGLWAMYFALMDRDRHVQGLINAAFRLVEAGGRRSLPYYFFGISGPQLPAAPWRNGMVYILPRATFEQQEVLERGALLAEIQQWASLVPVAPLARLAVTPEDFPFLAQIHRYDSAALREHVQRNPGGFPWLEE